MTFKSFKILSAIALMSLLTGLIFISGCKKKTTTPPDPNEEELITTVRLNFVDSAGVKPSITVMYKDLDGDGGNAPSVWDSIKLSSNTTYNMTIFLLNESVTPADTISNEVQAEAAEHLFCFETTGVPMQIVRMDTDGTYEVGLFSKWTTTIVGTGQAQVILKHQPDVKNGSCSLGSTDLDISFPLQVN